MLALFEILMIVDYLFSCLPTYPIVLAGPPKKQLIDLGWP